MSQDITPFDPEKAGIPSFYRAGVQWFLLKAFCEKLGISVSRSQTIATRLPKDSILLEDWVDVLGRKRPANFINNKGIAWILGSSVKDIPKTLRAEVFEGIVEDGGYIVPWITSEQILRMQGKLDYVKINNGLAAAIDYDPKSNIARWFFADVRNAFLEAVTGMRAKEIIAHRDGEIVTWTGKTGPTKDDKKTAMNYLDEDELELFGLFLTNAMTQTMLRFHKKSYTMAEYLSAIRKSVILS